MQENWTHGHSKSPSIKPELGHESLLHGGFESVPACHRGVEWDRGPFMCVLQEISVAILLLIRVYLCVCLSMRPSHRKSWITFERLNGFRWNFNVLLRWSGVTFGWVIRLPSPSQGGPSLQPVLSLKWNRSVVVGATRLCHTILESCCWAKQPWQSRFLNLWLASNFWVMRVGTPQRGLICVK